MRIIKFTAENVKKLKAVEIVPYSSVIEITGPNGSGKSSALDAIWYAACGGEVIPDKVVREGEESAFVKLWLGDGQVTEMIVSRTFSVSGTTKLTVQPGDPKLTPFRSPQQVLDSFVGALTFDPLEFIRMDPRDQVDELRRVVVFAGDLDKIEQETKRLVEERTLVNRDVRAAEGKLAATPQVVGADEEVPEAVSVSALMTEIEQAHAANAERNRERESRAARLKGIESQVSIIESYAYQSIDIINDAEKRCKKIMEEAENKKFELQSKALRLTKQIEEEKNLILKLEPVTDNTETGALVQRVREAESINKKIEAHKLHVERSEVVKLLKARSEQLTATIDAYVLDRAKIIAEAKMPVEGLSIGDGHVEYLGLPIENASSAEQLRVSVGIAMAANPKLRVLRVKDGSLLDEKSLAALTEIVTANDYQLWIERVEETDQRPCVVMEDGAIKA